MANDLIYTGIRKMPPPVAEKEDEEKKGFVPLTDQQAIDAIQAEQEQQTAPPQPNGNILPRQSDIDRSQFVADDKMPVTDPIGLKVKNGGTLTNDEWLKWSGQDQLPELQAFTDEKRESRAQKQQDMYNLSQALRGVFSNIAGGADGMYQEKFKPDTTTPRIQRELQNIRNASDADERRVRLSNLQSDIRKLGLYNQYSNRQDDMQFRSDQTDKQITAQDARYKQQNKEWDRRYGDQNTTEYLEKVAEIERKKQIAIDNAKTANDVKNIEAQAKKEMDILDYKYEKGYQNQTGANRSVITVTGEDGKKKGMTRLEVGDEAYTIRGELSNLYKSNRAEFDKLPQDIQFIVLSPDALSAKEEEMLVRAYYSALNKQKPSTKETNVGNYTGTSKAGKYTSGTK